ncbi:hypothetical protein [Spirosoma sp.]|uniref:hypothetical protein n=1 Tax=Spirosoma sp. TaxID=1899569 RepID=UPI003B3BCD63
MTTDHNPLPTARACAINFVLAHGDELPGGEHCDALTNLFTDVLLQFDRVFGMGWRHQSNRDRYRIAFIVAGTVLQTQLTMLHVRLDAAARFGWKIELARLILNYMQDRYGYDHSLSCLIDHYMLVNRAIDYLPN